MLNITASKRFNKFYGFGYHFSWGYFCCTEYVQMKPVSRPTAE